MKIFFKNCSFNGFEQLNSHAFAYELHLLMIKHKVKTICPTHGNNPSIERHIEDNELHLHQMYIEHE